MISALKQAITCAETAGCVDFMSSGVTISSASDALGGLGTLIVDFAENRLKQATQSVASEESALSEGIENIERTFDLMFSKKLIYFTDLQIARFVIEYMLFQKVYYGISDQLIQAVHTVEKTLKGMEPGQEYSLIDWLFQLLVDYTIIRRYLGGI